MPIGMRIGILAKLLGELPEASLKSVGVLRLRGASRSRSIHSAQDDKNVRPVKMSLIPPPPPPPFQKICSIKSPNSPLNPVFHPFITFFVPKRHGFNSIRVTHSTHRNFWVSQVGFPWISLCTEVPGSGTAGTVLISRAEESESRMHKPIKYVEKAVTVAA